MQIIKGVAIAAVLINCSGYFEQQESWKDNGSRKGRKHDRKN